MSRSRLPLLAALVAGSVLWGPQPVRAHAIESSLQRIMELRESMDRASGDTAAELQLESRFSNGLPASAARVRLLPPDGGEPIELGSTDESGQFQFRLPAEAGNDWEIQVDAGPGHRDYLEMPGSGPAAAPAGGFPAALGRAEATPLARRLTAPPAVLALGLVGGLGLGLGSLLLGRRHSR